jgi:hypothetical protein
MSYSRKGGRGKTVKNNYDYLEHLHEGEPIFVVTKNTRDPPRIAVHTKITFQKDPEGVRHFMVNKTRYSASGVTRVFVRRNGTKNTQAFNGPRHLGMCVPRTLPDKGAHVVRLRDLTGDHKRCTAPQAKALLKNLGAAPSVTIQSPKLKTPMSPARVTRSSSRGMGANTRSKTPR